MKFVSFGISAISVLWWFPFCVSSLEYTIISVESSTTNENYISSDLTVKLISRGYYGVSGYIYLNKDFLANDVMAEGTTGYNSQHYKSFVATPFHIGPMDFLSSVNGYYKKYIMRTVANCSNFPQSDTDFENLEDFGKNITVNECVLDLDSFAEMRSGFYCLTLNLTKSVDGETPFNAIFKYIIQFDNYF